jgi:hypothetical protein
VIVRKLFVIGIMIRRDKHDVMIEHVVPLKSRQNISKICESSAGG